VDDARPAKCSDSQTDRMEPCTCGRPAGGRADRQMDGWTDGRTDGVGRQAGRQTDRQMDGWMDGQTDRRTDGRTHRHLAKVDAVVCGGREAQDVRVGHRVSVHKEVVARHVRHQNLRGGSLCVRV
jgi:hypothetical protein